MSKDKGLVFDVPDWHKDMHEHQKDKIPRLGESVKKGQERFEEYGEFSEELFSRLYSNDNIKRKDGVEKWRKWAQDAHDVLDDLPEFKTLTPRVKYSEKLSAIAAGTLSKSINERIPDPPDNEKVKNMTGVMESIDALKASIKDQNDAIGPQTPMQQKLASKLKSSLAAQQSKIQRSIANQPAIQPHQMRAALRSAIDKTTASIDKTLAVLAAVGKDAADIDDLDDNFSELMMSHLQNSELFRAIIELAGRLRHVMVGLRAKNVSYTRSEVVGITQGNDLSRVLPSELAMLEISETLFLSKMAKGQLLQYKLDGVDTIGKGPIIVCVDFSGSMGGTREKWARAIALALLNQAKHDDRKFAACLFNTEIAHSFDWNSPPKSILEFCSKRSGGGTSFKTALTWAMERVEEDKKADIIFITDGEDGVSPSFLTTIKQQLEDNRILGIHIGSYSSSLHEFCDKVWDVSSFEDAVEGLLLEVMKDDNS